MKRSLLVALALLFCVTTSFAELDGIISVYADEAGTECNIVDNGGLLQVHMLHVRTTRATGGWEFKLDVSATNWTYLGDIWDIYVNIGNSVDGVTLGHSSCLSGSIHLGLATFIGSSAPPCTEISIVPHPGKPAQKIRAVDCWDDKAFYPTGGLAYINPDLSCQCSVPVEETTWGQIKALYR